MLIFNYSTLHIVYWQEIVVACSDLKSRGVALAEVLILFFQNPMLHYLLDYTTRTITFLSLAKVAIK